MGRRKASEIPGYVPKPRKRKPRKSDSSPPGAVIQGVEHVPTAETRARVASLAVVSTQKDVATIMGMSEPTLVKHYALELRTAKASANAKVAGVLYGLASSGKNLGATIFWLKSQAGWREKIDVSHTVTLEQLVTASMPPGALPALEHGE